MKIVTPILMLFFLYATYGVYVSRFSLNVMPTGLQPSHPKGFYDYKGITNAHSNKNQGSGSHQEIIDAAIDEGFDFLFFTDLNDFNGKKQIDGYQNRLLVFTGGAYSYLNTHLLHYKAHEKPKHTQHSSAHLFFTDFLSQKRSAHKEDFVVLAHPLKESYQWNGTIPEALEGIEVLNLKSVWQKSLSESKLSFLLSVFTYFFNSKHSLIRLYLEPKKEIHLWDRLNQKQKVVGLAGHNSTAKALPSKGVNLHFPSYRRSFSLISNHVILTSELTGIVNQDQEKIFQALKKGQFYFSLDFLENPKGFITYVTKNNRKYLMGSDLKLTKKPIKLFAHLPERPHVPFEIVVIKDGQRYRTFNNHKVELELTKKGVYRIIVRVIPTFPLPDGKRWITWIYSNPFYIKGS